MRIITYKQSTCESCLPACLLMIYQLKSGKSFSSLDERQLLIKGLLEDELYIAGMLKTFFTSYNSEFKVYADNLYFAKKLRFKLPKKAQVLKTDILKLIEERREVNESYIIYIDMHFLGKSIHYPHFVIVEKKLKGRLVIVDPWFGKRFYLKIEYLLKAVESLKRYLGFCPILIEFDNND